MDPIPDANPPNWWRKAVQFLKPLFIKTPTIIMDSTSPQPETELTIPPIQLLDSNQPDISASAIDVTINAEVGNPKGKPNPASADAALLERLSVLEAKVKEWEGSPSATPLNTPAYMPIPAAEDSQATSMADRAFRTVSGWPAF